MENLTLTIYLIEILSNIKTSTEYLSIGLFISFLVSVGIIALYNDSSYYMNRKNISMFKYKGLMWGFLFTLLITNIIPAKQTMYTMLGINVSTQVLQSEQGQVLTGEIGEIFEKSLTLLNNKIDETLEE